MKVYCALIVTTLLACSHISFASGKGDYADKRYVATSDTVKPQSYADLVSKAKFVKRGLINILFADDKYYFDIPREILGKDLLLVTRISKSAANGNQLYAGDEVSNMVIAFEVTSTSKMLLRKKIFRVHAADSTAPSHAAVTRSNLMPILWVFNIEAVSENEGRMCINVTDYISEDNEGMSLNAVIKARNSISTLLADKSFIPEVSAFPKNVEIVLLKTYTVSRQVGMAGGKPQTVAETITFELNASIIELPEHLMRQREGDMRVGYFAVQQMDYDANPGGVKIKSYIKRWRLEPAPKDVEKYKKGELVEPEKPIVFFIDPVMPPKWTPYIIQGVNDWQIAFEEAGFKNAIFAKPAPLQTEDSTWRLYDARHSAIVYKPSEIENASGPSICDPRSGEILESHINLYHNIVQLLHDWYMVQCSMADTNARKMVFSDELMGNLIRSVISHEVGHALGLRHNMGASNATPSEKLRDLQWLDSNGICPSIMDYARFNYVAQEGDRIPQKNLIARIGTYDKWAIGWGYKRIYNDNEKQILNRQISEKSNDVRYRFSSETSIDARTKTEDLGNNLTISNAYGIENLKKLVPHLIEWTKVPGEGYSNLSNMYSVVQDQLVTYLTHVIKSIGGINETIKGVDEKGPVYTPVNKSKQKEALAFLNRYFFTTPDWLLDTAILNRTGQTSTGVMASVQARVLERLLFPPLIFMSVARNDAVYGNKTYMMDDYLADLKKYIWTELYNNQPISLYRRSLQRTYIFYLLESLPISRGLLHSTFFPFSGLTNITAHDVPAYLNGHVMELLEDIKRKLSNVKDKASKYHLQFVHDQLKNSWEKIKRI
jgi:hypothetical protein